MGQVFTWDSIRTKKVPEQESFHRVAMALRTTLSTEPAIASALLFGSVVRGDFNIRSDIDCVVIYETCEEQSAMEAMHKVDRLAHTLHVPINYTPCDTVLAKTRLHHLGASFIRHLQASIDNGGLIKGDLVNLIAPTIPAAQEIESYIKMKMYSMQESFAQMTSFSEERLVAFLKKALEASTHVARKVLIYKGVLQGDSKREIQTRYRDIMPTRLATQFAHLLRIDSRYSLELVSQLENPDKDQYASVIARLQLELPNVIEFLRSNILHLNETC